MNENKHVLRDVLWVSWMGYVAYAVGLWVFGVEGTR